MPTLWWSMHLVIGSGVSPVKPESHVIAQIWFGVPTAKATTHGTP